MKITSGILFTISTAFIIYGYWGAFTEQGNKVYDEMDAMFPFFILISGVILLMVMLIVMIVRRRRSNR